MDGTPLEDDSSMLSDLGVLPGSVLLLRVCVTLLYSTLVTSYYIVFDFSLCCIGFRFAILN